MTPLIEIGEMLISDQERDYFFRPSFANMSRVGQPTGIVEAHYELHHGEVGQLIDRAIEAYGTIPAWLIAHINSISTETVKAAMNVMQACCDDDITPLIGEWKGWKRNIVRRRGSMGDAEIIIIARELIEHGVSGKAKVRQLQKNENAGDYSPEFRVFEYINAARTHFNMPREEAEQLTMTAFQLMLNAKYPPQKGFTRGEYDAVRDDYFKRREARIAAEKAKREPAIA
ncbi:DUF6246 family protein [Serratia fonticola]|uniref:DUF6246 family protein n=1 Tax=Serratia fonticola TaxID=47917 RepID=UPI003AAEB080